MENMKAWIAIGIIALLAVIGLTSYNSVAEAQNAVDAKMGDLQSAYQRRLDLIPNLVRTVEAAAAHEQRVQETVARLRSAQQVAAQAPAPGTSAAAAQQYDAAQRQLSVAIRATFEAYPQVTATGNFRDLQAQIEGTENRINVARRDYNHAVETFNNRLTTLPTKIFAGGRLPRTSFTASDAAQAAPVVQFGSGSPTPAPAQ